MNHHYFCADNCQAIDHKYIAIWSKIFIFLGKKLYFENNLSNCFLLLHSQVSLSIEKFRRSRMGDVPENSCPVILPGQKLNLNTTNLLRMNFFTVSFQGV